MIAFTNGVRHISCTPVVPGRAYTVEGKVSFPDGWSPLTNSSSRLFRVTVGLPD
jgi:hypothetical protein